MLPPPVTMLFAVMSQVPEDCKVTVPEKKDTDPVASTALEVGSPRQGAVAASRGYVAGLPKLDGAAT